MIRYSIFLILLAIFSAQCKKESSNTPLAPLGDRGMRVHVIDRNDQTLEETDVSGAAVKVFDNENNWNLDQNANFKRLTDSNGEVLFEFLFADTHYVRVEETNLGIKTKVVRTPPNAISIEEIIY